MEPIQGRHETSMFAPEEEEEDFNSTMPDNVLTNILDRLPLQNAASTSMRKWRFKWTLLISQLVFDEDFFSYLITKAENHPEIGRILHQLRGAITKCVLSLVDDELDVEDEDVIHWISFLSGKGIKDLTLEHLNETPYKLPTHLFSCLDLKHLKLHDCCFNPPPTFHGFPNLLSLEFYGADGELGGVITRCPLLEILKLENAYASCKVKLDEIARLENLKILSLSLRNLDTTKNFSSSSTIIELLGSLPKLQQLELNFLGCKLIEGVANKGLSIAFPCLMALKLSCIDLLKGMKLSCAFELIRSCPNLQTLEITASNSHADSPLQLDYSTTGLLQLRNVTFECLTGSENELRLIKYLLASSPFLQKIVIRLRSSSMITPDEKLKFASKLLKLHRASPVAEIDF
ncbi:F-box/FBD/LRR-repeat protein At1g13570-like isoform X2 [Bidens hawaiensis]|uniref:F-box/FBD/LRR-repeat protein At1g13570-like isoform X2 n=1 Tax=Bidens hawaiensis TaxID=980011 RepID=UPI00404B3C5A